MDLDQLDALLAGGRIGTVVATAGTTGLGAIDPVHGVLAVARRHGVRVHVDAAYGGFYTLLAGQYGLDPAPWRAIGRCDSVVIDPHKHGLQPYGCGAVLFADPEVGRFYLHDSPYTYFTSDDLHLGEISLECSRAGAAAAALWLTFRLLPPTAGRAGPGPGGLPPGRAGLVGAAGGSVRLDLYQPPELDIVIYFPLTAGRRLSAIDDGHRRGCWPRAWPTAAAGVREHAAGHGRRVRPPAPGGQGGRRRRPYRAQRADEARGRGVPGRAA